MYWPQIQEMNEDFIAAGKPLVANGAPASILCSFPNPDQVNLGYVVMVEFFVDSFIAIVIWACLDPANVSVMAVTDEVLAPSGARRPSTDMILYLACLCIHTVRLCTSANSALAIRCARSCTIHHWACLREHGLGFRRCDHRNQPGEGSGHEDCGRNILGTRGLFLHELLTDWYLG